MTALAASRSTPQMGTSTVPDTLSMPMKASSKVYAGGIVVLSSGYAKAGATAASLIAVGVAEEDVDNTSGGNGDLNVRVRQGVFKFVNSGADPVAQADVGADVYIVDDQTIAKTSNSSARSRAGKLVKFESTGVWVQIGIGL